MHTPGLTRYDRSYFGLTLWVSRGVCLFGSLRLLFPKILPNILHAASAVLCLLVIALFISNFIMSLYTSRARIPSKHTDTCLFWCAIPFALKVFLSLPI